MLGVLLHLLEVLLLTPEAPGVVLELGQRVAVAALQPVVDHLRLPQPLQLHVLLLRVEAATFSRGGKNKGDAPGGSKTGVKQAAGLPLTTVCLTDEEKKNYSHLPPSQKQSFQHRPWLRNPPHHHRDHLSACQYLGSAYLRPVSFFFFFFRPPA